MKKREKELLRKKSILELDKEYQERAKELVRTRFQHAKGKLKDIKKIAKIRNNIAVVKTIISEKRLMEKK